MLIPQIDITMTAVLRPKILDETLRRIIKNVVDDPDRFRLIINVDQVGEKIKPAKIVKIAERHFSNVVSNIAKTPSFPKAVKWVWENSDAPFVFHWEDDVNILRKINVKKMIEILNEDKSLSSLRLYKYRIPRKKKMKTFSCMWKYNEKGYYIADDWERQFRLNPILIKREFIDEAVQRMIDDVNPEKQFRSSQKYMVPLIKKWKYGIYAKPGEGPLINGKKGQHWKNKMKLQKPDKEKFLSWVQKR